jgi:hypothetical protein
LVAGATFRTAGRGAVRHACLADIGLSDADLEQTQHAAKALRKSVERDLAALHEVQRRSASRADAARRRGHPSDACIPSRGIA